MSIRQVARTHLRGVQTVAIVRTHRRVAELVGAALRDKSAAAGAERAVRAREKVLMAQLAQALFGWLS